MASVPRFSLDEIPVSFAIASVGTPANSLPSKLHATSTAGSSAIELGFPNLVGWSDSPKNEISMDKEILAGDLRELADMLAEPGFKLVYENWCLSNHAPTWKDAWALVHAVDRPNIGLCLDTFQTAAYEYADPTISPPYTPHARQSHSRRRGGSRRRRAKPLESKMQVGMKSRPFPLNGGYLPLTDVARAVLRTGFRGWFSTELFDAGPEGRGFMAEKDFGTFCEGAVGNYRRLLDECADS